MQRDLRVLLARLRVLKLIIRGIIAVAIHLHRVFRHFRLVEANVSQILAVGRPGHQVRHRELLLINPVGDAVQDLVQLAIFRHLHLRVVVELTDPDVVVAYESAHTAVRREGRDHLLAGSVGDRLHIVTAHVIVVDHHLA